MRVLSIGHRMQNRLIDNHTIFNAPNVSDYEAIVVDLAAIFDSVVAAARAQSEFVTHTDVPVVNGESLDGAAGLASLLNRRRDEFVRALDNGATVCVFMTPQSRFHGVNGLNGFDRYYFLPAPDGMNWDEQTITGAEGVTVAVADHGHPFVSVFEVFAKQVLYRAAFNQRAPGFAKHAKTFLRAAGGDPVGVELPVLNGRLVFMPTPREVGTSWLASKEGSAMTEAMASSLARNVIDMPRWASEFTPPGLADREVEIRQARAALEQAQATVDEAEASAATLRSIRDVLWSTGDATLLPAVLACAEAIGFKRFTNPNGEAVITHGSQLTIQLVAAGSTEAVDMAPHYRLRERIDHIIETRATKPRGLIVVNGQRQTHPTERKRQWVESLRVGAEAIGYALISAADLYRVAHAALAGAPETMIEEARTRLATTDGVVTFDDLFEPDAPKPAEVEPAESEPAAAAEPEDEPEAEADTESAADETSEE